MVIRSLLCGLAALFAVASSRQGWTANGTSACQKYLTPEFVTAVLGVPSDPPVHTDANSCRTANMYITLDVKDVNDFRRELPLIAGTHVISGIGDAAYWNEAGTVSAVKGHDRGCRIGVFLPRQTNMQNAQLAQKLGEICNKLFALP